MTDKASCWFAQVADEFERVSRIARNRLGAKKSAQELAALAESIRRDCGCGGTPQGGHRDDCANKPAKGD